MQISNEFLTVNSVKVGSIIIPFSSLNAHLGNFVRSVLIEHDDPYSGGILGRSGSSTLIQVFGKRYICLTKHELKNMDLSNVRVVSNNETALENITFNNSVFPVGAWSEEEEFKDIILLETEHQTPEKLRDYNYFMPIKPFDRKQIFASLIVACPIYDDSFEVDYENSETRGFHETTVVRDCVWDAQYKGHAKFVEQFTFDRKSIYPENGMSGGAVFSIVDSNGDLEVFLHGIITRAGGIGRLTVVNCDFLLNVKHSRIS